jgi:hypothetical protein
MKVIIGNYTKYNKRIGKTPERKISIRIDKFDTWNLDHTLALIILPCLKQLKKTTHGAPNTDNEERMPSHLLHAQAKPKKNEDDLDSNHFERWNWILDEMIWAFEQELKEDEEKPYHSGKVDIRWQAMDKDDKPIGKPEKMGSRRKTTPEVSHYRMVHGPKHTYTTDKEGLKKHYERKANGFRLFGKYYQNLWD